MATPLTTPILTKEEVQKRTNEKFFDLTPHPPNSPKPNFDALKAGLKHIPLPPIDMEVEEDYLKEKEKMYRRMRCTMQFSEKNEDDPFVIERRSWFPCVTNPKFNPSTLWKELENWIKEDKRKDKEIVIPLMNKSIPKKDIEKLKKKHESKKIEDSIHYIKQQRHHNKKCR